MKRLGLLLAIGLASVCCYGALHASRAAAQKKGGFDAETTSMLIDRLSKLERRVESLERQLSVRTLRRPTVLEAERALASAKKRLRFTERLVKGGFATSEAQKQDFFAVQKAEKRVELAKAAMARDVDRIRLELGKMETQFHLSVAKERLLYNRRLFARGFVPDIAVTEAKLAVQRATERADQAKAALEKLLKK